MTTKDQERAALDKISKIVNGLGEESYVGAAFKGCFEIAKDNICNDFMCSPLDRVEALEKRCGDLTRKNTELYDKNRQLSKRVLGDDVLDSIKLMLAEYYVERSREERENAESIVENADNPGSARFKSAVAAHRSAKDKVKKANEVINLIRQIMGE